MAPGRCQDQGQVLGTSDWQLIWDTIALSVCLWVLCRGLVGGGDREYEQIYSVRHLSPMRRHDFDDHGDGDSDSVDDGARVAT